LVSRIRWARGGSGILLAKCAKAEAVRMGVIFIVEQNNYEVQQTTKSGRTGKVPWGVGGKHCYIGWWCSEAGEELCQGYACASIPTPSSGRLGPLTSSRGAPMSPLFSLHDLCFSARSSSWLSAQRRRVRGLTALATQLAVPLCRFPYTEVGRTPRQMHHSQAQSCTKPVAPGGQLITRADG